MAIARTSFLGLAPLILGLTGTAAMAQPSAEPYAQSADAVVDPARRTAAQSAVDHLFPLGTYERMMRGTLDKMMDSMMASMFDMSAADMAKMGGVDAEEAEAATEGKTMAELVREADPHFDERMQITMRVMMDEMVTLMSELEPDIRATLVEIYARKFTTAQLGELNLFFETDTGAAFARDYMMVFVEDEMIAAMTGLVPKIMQTMPAIQAKVAEATAHLPPVPSKEESNDDGQ